MSDHDTEQLCAAYRKTVEDPPYDRADAALLRIAQLQAHRHPMRLTYAIAATLIAALGLTAGVRSLVTDSRRPSVEVRAAVPRKVQTPKPLTTPFNDYLAEAVLSSDPERHDSQQRDTGFLRQTSESASLSAQAGLGCGTGVVDLNAPGAFARLKASRPDDYARMMRIIAGVTRHPELDVARWISATFDAANVSYLPLWMTSLPPKRRLSLCLASTDYTVVLTITQDGARVSPALSAPPHLH